MATSHLRNAVTSPQRNEQNAVMRINAQVWRIYGYRVESFDLIGAAGIIHHYGVVRCSMMSVLNSAYAVRFMLLR